MKILQISYFGLLKCIQIEKKNRSIRTELDDQTTENIGSAVAHALLVLIVMVHIVI